MQGRAFHLSNLPVNEGVGEVILEVVPDDTAWEFTVNVPEDEAGQLLRAYGALQSGEVLSARIILFGYPNVTFEASVLSVAPRAHVETTGEQKYRNVIEVRVAEPPGFRQKVEPRQGMEGKVAVECGRRSFFYAVTHEFVDFLRVSLF